LVKQHGRVHLIASAGGVAAQRSALEELSGPIPFVYLSGRLPAPPDLPSSSGDGKYCGVILNTSGQYGDALRSFARLGVASDDVWLVQNYNSDMTQEEWLEWPSISNNNNRVRFFEPQPPPPLRPINNNEALFRSEVTRLSTLTPAPKGIVVSSDPFFRSKANEFTTAMSALRVAICSPFKDFPRSGNDFMLPGGATLSSSNIADTNTAFYQLGLRAADVLDNSTAASPIPATPRVSKKWNGTAWVDA